MHWERVKENFPGVPLLRSCEAGYAMARTFLLLSHSSYWPLNINATNKWIVKYFHSENVQTALSEKNLVFPF